MPEFRVVVDYTSKRSFTVSAADPAAAALLAMRQLQADDAAAGPVGYLVLEGDLVVAEQRAWGAKRKRSKTS